MQVDPTSNAKDHLLKGDVVTHFDDVPVANDGTVAYRAGERISFHYLKSLKFVGDECRLRLLRDGKPMEVRVRWTRHEGRYYALEDLCGVWFETEDF
jgi:S1-C subfamily serine protease